MVTMPQLRDADPALFSDAAEAWDRWAKRYDGYAREFDDEVGPRLKHWRGRTSELAKGKISRLQTVLHTAPPELRGIAGTLRSASSTFTAAQQELTAAIGHAARSGFTVADDGSVNTPPVMYAPGDKGAAIARHKEDLAAADRIAGQIRAAVEKATRADETAAAALRAATKAAATAGTQPVAAGVSPAEAAALVRQAARGDRAALEKLKDFKHLFADPYFAHELMQQLGAKRLTELPGTMSKHLADVVNGDVDGDPRQIIKDNRALLGMLSDALAAATDPDNPFWTSDSHYEGFLDHLKQQGRSMDHELPGGNDFSGYWGLGQIMNAADNHPPYSTRFLDEIGNDMIAWDQQRQAGGPGAMYGPYHGGGPYGLFNQPGSPADQAGTQADPLSGLLHAASTNGVGAQELLLDNVPNNPDFPTRFDDQSNLEYLLSGRLEWADRGNDLGEAIEAATAGSDKQAAQITSQTVHLLGEGLTSDEGMVDARLGNMRDSLGAMFSNHIADVNNTVNGHSSAPGNWVHDLRDGGYGANFVDKDLALVMEFTADDKGAYQDLVNAQIGYTKQQMEAAANAPVSPDMDGADQLQFRIDGVRGAAMNGSKTLGFIVEAHAQGLTEEALAADQRNGMLADYAKQGLGLIPVPGGPVANLAADQVTEALANQIRTNHFADARADANSYRLQTQYLMDDMIQRTMADNHLYPPGLGPEHWQESSPGYSRNPFWDPGANRLLTPEQMGPDGAENFRKYASSTQGGLGSIGATENYANGSYIDGASFFQTSSGSSQKPATVK